MQPSGESEGSQTPEMIVGEATNVDEATNKSGELIDQEQSELVRQIRQSKLFKTLLENEDPDRD